jgi:hypothetical protein
MRVTAIAQGINRWLNNLHRQVPLTGRESQRLLDALTGSFRAKLDEAHPTKAQDEPYPATKKTESKVLAIPKVSRPSPKTAPDPVRATSAVESADRHLASVLTSPLLMGALPAASKSRSVREKERRHQAAPDWQIKQNAAVKALQIDNAVTKSTPLKPKTLREQARILSPKPTDIARILQEPSLLADMPEIPAEKDQHLTVNASEARKDQRTHSAANDDMSIGLGLDEQNFTGTPRRVVVSSRPVRRENPESNRDNLWYHLARPAS